MNGAARPAGPGITALDARAAAGSTPGRGHADILLEQIDDATGD